MNYHLERLQKISQTAKGLKNLLETVVDQIAPTSYDVNGAHEDWEKDIAKLDVAHKHIKLLTEQLDEAGVTVEATGCEEALGL